jgi:subtilisin family serine protease
MSSKIEKLDSALNTAYHAWAENPELAPDAGISVNLLFQDELAAIEALGFETHSVQANQALGVVRFKDIPELVKHPGVRWLAVGRRRKKHLNSAARDIRARATAPISGTPVDGVWHVEVATGALTKVPKGTGQGVIVAIMDTGIDITHPMFMSQLTPTKKTRILKIWDQGLAPASSAEWPTVTLVSTKPYGVEYDSAKIEAHLAGGTTIRHRDCDGHGTHVAGIAAGGPLFPTDGDASKVGVAPEADIIVVKYLDNPEKIFFRNPDNSTTTDEVEWPARFRDAVIWCIRTARKIDANKAVVINMSFGDAGQPGDALDEDAVWLDDVLNPANAESDAQRHFPKGAIVVKSAGNDGDEDGRRVARIRIPISGEVIVPLLLIDGRLSADTDWKECAQRLHKPEVSVHFWYRRAPAPLSVRFSAKLPHGSIFGAEVMTGGILKLGFRPIVGPPKNDIAIAFADKVHRYTLEHEDNPKVEIGGVTLAHRHHVQFFVEPKVTGGSVAYHPGIYEMRIRADAGTEIFCMCDAEFWNDEGVTFVVNDALQDGTAIDPTEITILEEFTSVDPLGRHVITVAAYNDTDGFAASAKHHHVADFSSRGPLRDYSDPANPVTPIPKPDVAAPGVRIDSAHGRDTKEGLVWHLPSWWDGDRFQNMDGTSMAAPFITGVVALLLEKNPGLSVTDVRTRLAHAPRAAVNPATAPASTNAYGVGMVDALDSHNQP